MKSVRDGESVARRLRSSVRVWGCDGAEEEKVRDMIEIDDDMRFEFVVIATFIRDWIIFL